MVRSPDEELNGKYRLSAPKNGRACWELARRPTTKIYWTGKYWTIGNEYVHSVDTSIPDTAGWEEYETGEVVAVTVSSGGARAL